jgi:hypothetical protein
MSCLTSLELDDLERSWLSLARMLGCSETRTLGGRAAMVMVSVYG